jgi:heme/copper-type cytochrome/quinol oxidase subunit 3
MPLDHEQDPDGTKRWTFWFYISPEKLIWGCILIASLIVIFSI